MKLINFENNKTVLNESTMNEFQNNIKEEFDKDNIYIEISMLTNQNIVAGNNTVINFNKKERGEGIELNNNTLIVSKAGIYLIELDLHYTNLTLNSRAFGDIVISNNGEYGDKVLRTNDTQQYAGDAFFNGLGLIQLAEGANITFKTYTTYTNDLMGTASPKTRAFVKRI